MSDTATLEVSEDLKTIGDKIAGLTLKEAKSLSDYLKDAHGIEPAAGGAVMMAGPAAGAGEAAPAAKTEFDVELTSFGDKKLDVVKVVKDLCGLSLMDAKKTTESAPTVLKPGVAKDEAEAMKKKLEEAGATVTLK
ncbi:MAG TPA: 50S ribosomal protein L7/L12 [Pirellulaceae bacterium]|jgi:large subunit ribosomal protein L7/L12|nr:50S ribosomal protein L7/L12 [Pirellulaceae bacterium]